MQPNTTLIQESCGRYADVEPVTSLHGGGCELCCELLAPGLGLELRLGLELELVLALILGLGLGLVLGVVWDWAWCWTWDCV